MFKIKIVTIFLVLCTTLFTILSGCSGGGSKDNPIKPVVIDPGVYVEVPANTKLGVPAFHVMKYEAKMDTSAVGTGMAVSKEDGEPWGGVNRRDAVKKCKLINSEISEDDIKKDVNKDGTYALISNPQWMSLARNIENVAENWTSGIVGTGCLFRGNVGATIACQGPAGSENVDSSYNHGEPDYGPNRRSSTAKLTFRNGEKIEEIWDLSGNLWEITDWRVLGDEKAYVSADCEKEEKPEKYCGPTVQWRDFKNLDKRIEKKDKMHPDSWAPSNLEHPGNPDGRLDLDGSNGIGRYSAGKNIGNTAFRGGAFDIDLEGARFNTQNNSQNVGIFTLAFSLHIFYSFEDKKVNTNQSAGFRCVYRPNVQK